MKRALVTGASSALGGAIARHLAAQSYRVGLHYYSNRSAVEEWAARIRVSGGHADILSGDLSRDPACSKLLQEWLGTEGKLDVLVNNAGVYDARALMDLTEEEWLRGIASTATATFFMTRAAVPYLRRGESGRIVNIGDSSCDRPGARDLAAGYHIGKTGVLILTKSFAAELAGMNISVNMISPGYLENSVGLPVPETIPAGRFGKFSDIICALDFFLSPESAYCTGSNLIVSGGWNIR